MNNHPGGKDLLDEIILSHPPERKIRGPGKHQGNAVYRMCFGSAC
jgi:hypothetical protein